MKALKHCMSTCFQEYCICFPNICWTVSPTSERIWTYWWQYVSLGRGKQTLRLSSCIKSIWEWWAKASRNLHGSFWEFCDLPRIKARSFPEVCSKCLQGLCLEAIPGHWPFRSMGPPSTSLHPLKMQLRNGKLLVWAVSWPSSGHNQRRSSSWDNYTWLSDYLHWKYWTRYHYILQPRLLPKHDKAWQSMLSGPNTCYESWPDYTIMINNNHIISYQYGEICPQQPEKNLPPVQSPRIHRSQDLEKSPTCLEEWQGGKTWELRHQI